MPKPKSIDDYLTQLEGPRRAALVKLRKTVHALLPDAVECISYSMPAFRYEGQVVAGFLATRRGCSYFPFSGTTLATLAAELASFSQTKSALHFEPARPLPASLVKKLLAARIAEIGAKPAAKRSKPRAPKRGVTAKRSAKHASRARGTPRTSRSARSLVR